MKMKKLAMLTAAILIFMSCVDALAESGDGVNHAAAPTATPTAAPTASPEPEEENITSFVLASDPAAAEEPKPVRPEMKTASHIKYYRYSENVLLKGLFQKSGYYFQVADYWDVQYVLAQIEYKVSPLITGNVPASMTFFINDYPIDSCAVHYNNGVTQVTYVKIPVDLLREDYNEFAITGYVNHFDENGCLDDFSGANWISISKGSVIELGYELINTENRISYYPFPLISAMDETGERMTVYVPENACEGELLTAFMVRASLANSTGDEDHISLCRLTQYTEGENALIVSLRKNLPQEALLRMPGTARDYDTGCLIYEYGEGESHTLVITSDNPDCLAEGACLLMDPDRVSQEKKDWTYVPAGMKEMTVTQRSLSSLISNGTTLKGILGSDGIDFVGPFHQESVIYLPFSGGFVLGEGGTISLLMRYSDNLDFDRSLVTVFWGSTPIASRKLTKEKASADLFTFSLPADVVGTHAASLTIAFELEVKELYCTKRSDEMPWAWVSGESTLYLPSGNGSSYNLSLRPYPFLHLGQYNHLAVVVPDRMTDTELQLFGRIAALYGTDASPYGDIRVFFASAYPKETEASNVITLGTWEDNAVIRELNERLSFRYETGGKQFASNDQIILSENYASTIGVLQIIDSPWQAGKAILVVSGTTEEALANIDRFCAIQKNNWTLTGDAFLIDTDLETKSFTFLQEKAAEQPSLRERLEKHKDAVLITLAAAGALALLFLGILIMLLRYRKNRRKEAK